MSRFKSDFVPCVNPKSFEDNEKRPVSAVTRTIKPSISYYIFPNRSRQNLISKEFSPFLMMVKSLEKEKPHQEGSNLNYDAKVIKSSRKSLPIDLKYPERFSILTRPETARAINSCSSIFKFGKSTKLPEKGKELNTKGKEFFSPSRCKQLSLAESEDITILPKELSKFTDFNYSTPEEVSLYSSLNLMPSFKSPEKIESYRNFGIKITPKPLTSRHKCRSHKIFK